MIIVANNSNAIPPKTISGHDCNSSAVNKPIVDQIKAIIIKSNIGNIFCFWRWKSVKNKMPDIIKEPKLLLCRGAYEKDEWRKARPDGGLYKGLDWKIRRFS